MAPEAPDASLPAAFPFAGRRLGYGGLVETRVARGQFFAGPCAIWFRLRHPLLPDEVPSVYQRVAVAADSGNGISAVLDFKSYTFVNSDLTINLLRRPRGEWICLDARTHLGPDGCGLAESALFDTDGLIGRATQSLFGPLAPLMPTRRSRSLFSPLHRVHPVEARQLVVHGGCFLLQFAWPLEEHFTGDGEEFGRIAGAVSVDQRRRLAGNRSKASPITAAQRRLMWEVGRHGRPSAAPVSWSI